MKINTNSSDSINDYASDYTNLTIVNKNNRFDRMIIVFYISAIALYLIAAVTFFMTENSQIENLILLAIPFLLLFAIFMIVVLYYIIKKNTKRTEHELLIKEITP